MTATQTTTKERPILFSGPMVRAILDGRKTQTRRVVKPQPIKQHHIGWLGSTYPGYHVLTHHATRVEGPLVCPYGKPGDQLWVREPWQAWAEFDGVKPSEIPQHYADGLGTKWNAALSCNYLADGNKWKSRYRHARFMPRWASRLLLEIAAVRVERLKDITEADAIAEGTGIETPQNWLVAKAPGIAHRTARGCFETSWNMLHGPEAFACSPWVWVVEFKRVEVK